MYANEDLHPVMAGYAELDKADFARIDAFGKTAAPAAAGKLQPFYLAPDPVAAFMKALQKSLGLPATGVWNQATHEALGAWFHNYELTVEIPQEQSQGQPGYQTPIPAWGENPQDTAQGFAEIMDAYMEKTPALVQALGFASSQAMNSDSKWLLNKEAVGAAIVAHVAAQEAVAVSIVPVPPADCVPGKYKDASGNCIDIPPTVTVRPVTTKSWYKRPTTWAVAGGVLLLIVVAVAAARKEG